MPFCDRRSHASSLCVPKSVLSGLGFLIRNLVLKFRQDHGIMFLPQVWGHPASGHGLCPLPTLSVLPFPQAFFFLFLNSISGLLGDI